jgi:ParB-like chromosome segregation protein Spo0J
MQIKEVELEQIGMDFERLRVVDPGADQRIRNSLEIHGQLSPLLVGESEDKLILVDGFKRLRSMRLLKKERILVCGIVRSMLALKAMVLMVNHEESACRELEEALVVESLYRDDGLQQQEIAILCNRHKSWVCRRIAFIERLGEEVQEQLRLGLVTITTARELIQLPRGNQREVLDALRTHRLSSRQSRHFIGKYLDSPSYRRHALLNDPWGVIEPARRRRIDCGVYTPTLTALERQVSVLDALLVRHGLGVLSHEQRAELGSVIDRIATRCAAQRATVSAYRQEMAPCR